MAVWIQVVLRWQFTKLNIQVKEFLNIYQNVKLHIILLLVEML